MTVNYRQVASYMWAVVSSSAKLCGKSMKSLSVFRTLEYNCLHENVHLSVLFHAVTTNHCGFGVLER